ncbi:UNVERIFIED_CONTAM: hypothetical protein Sradi_2982000, partial [Sesamum radiatum]
RGATVHWKFIRHHSFGEGDALSFILGGSSNMILDVLKDFLKVFKESKALWRNLLRSRWESPLPPDRGYRDRDIPTRLLFWGVYIGRVAIRVGASATTCSRIAAKTICWMTPNSAGDSSSVEVSEEVLRRGRSATGLTTLEGDGIYAKATWVDPPTVEVGGIPVTTCKA